MGVEKGDIGKGNYVWGESNTNIDWVFGELIYTTEYHPSLMVIFDVLSTSFY